MKSFKINEHCGISGILSGVPIIFIISLGSLDNFAQAGKPCTISIKQQPSDQISAENVCPSLFATSGAIQYGLPFKDFVIFSSSASNSLDDPKSVSFIMPSCVMRRLAHFKSL